ncbi:Peroxin 13, N-terminal region-domain-containing protein [Zychaea mexicana]|uniref:Peroxin 13, N-terminal region-domain-containing protein n=1 Tax=Zychaea mexicana TaxID=64656 RepID=UPI0022FF19A7|nr:Peroxin 13, N-terminal region-domain-containing protein [Zychaea mexicana]KAI9490499.1 Peroxin 13, N-terminal region-domain-containing protein [Zychaea mexicana]
MGGYGGYGSYSSPYSRYGSSYGGYGSSYGGYGGYGSYGGLGGFGSPYSRFGGGGMMGGPGDEFGQQGGMESSTRATFEVISQVVSAFGGFAQMLDSTFMATHSSFMAMVGVAEQFGNLQHYLGNLFSIYAWIRWFKRLFYRLTGREIPPELLEQPPQQEGQQRQLEGPEGQEGEQQQQQQQPIRRKRSILFALAIFLGLPYALYKLFQRAREYNQRRLLLQGKEELATVMHDFVAEGPMELNLRQGQTIFVTSKVDPATGHSSDWWQGRLENGAVGIFPANYVMLQPPSGIS